MKIWKFSLPFLLLLEWQAQASPDAWPFLLAQNKTKPTESAGSAPAKKPKANGKSKVAPKNAPTTLPATSPAAPKEPADVDAATAKDGAAPAATAPIDPVGSAEAESDETTAGNPATPATTDKSPKAKVVPPTNMRKVEIGLSAAYRSIKFTAKKKEPGDSAENPDFTGLGFGLNGAYRLGLSKSAALYFGLGLDYGSVASSTETGVGKMEVILTSMSLVPGVGITGGALGGSGFIYSAGLELFYAVSQKSTIKFLGQESTDSKPFESFLLYGLNLGAGYRISDMVSVGAQLQYDLGSSTSKAAESTEIDEAGNETITPKEKTENTLSALSFGLGVKFHF